LTGPKKKLLKYIVEIEINDQDKIQVKMYHGDVVQDVMTSLKRRYSLKKSQLQTI
jgi:hypothetical protein